jgi:hypothetical protein
MIYHAVKLFVEQNGQCSKELSTGFLSKDEQAALFDKSKFRGSLYKMLLFMHVADAIRSGKFNFKYSYRYKAIQDYLISDLKWKTYKQELVRKAGLSAFTDIDKILSDYRDKLSSLYVRVNHRNQYNLNSYLKINKQGLVSIKTPL